MPTVDVAPAPAKKRGMSRKSTRRTPFTRHQYELMELIYQFRFMRTHHIKMHLPHRHYRGINHSLKILEDRGMLLQDPMIYHNSIWELTKAGYDAIASRDLPPRYFYLEGGLEANRSREHNHTMMIADLLSNLVAGAKRAGVTVVSAEEIHKRARIVEPFIFKGIYRYKEKEYPFTKVPDAFIGFTYPEGGTAYFALEAEHNKANMRAGDFDPTSTQNSTRKLIRKYRDVDWQAVYRNLNVGNTRVLVAAPTRLQIINKITEGRSVTTDSHLILGSVTLVVDGKDVPVMPEIFDEPWLRIGTVKRGHNAEHDLPEEYICRPPQ